MSIINVLSLIVVTFYCCSIFSASVNGASEPCHLREFDLCMTSAVVFIRRPPSIKVSEELIERQCNLFKETEECIEKFTNDCMTKSQHQLVDFASGGMLKTMRQYCTKGSDLRKEYLEHGECVEKQRKNSNKCLYDFQAAVEKATTDATHWKERPKVLCCALDRYSDCLKSIIGPACGKEALGVASMLVSGTFSRATTVTCNKYKHESAECQKMLPPVGTKPKGAQSNSVISKLISTMLQS